MSEIPRLSLVAQFDDICRCSSLLNVGIEEEFSNFARLVAEDRSQRLLLIKQIDELKKEVQKHSAERDAFETKWKHVLNLMESEMKKYRKIEQEKKLLKKQISLIKDVLSDSNAVSLDDEIKEKLAFLNNNQPYRTDTLTAKNCLGAIEESTCSLLSSSDVSFDKTDDDVNNFGVDVQTYAKFPVRTDRQARTKRSFTEPSKKDAAKKKPKFDQLHESSDDDLDDIEHEQSFNENSSPSKVPHTPREVYKSEENRMHISEEEPVLVLGKNSSTPLRVCSSGKLNRAHVFCTKTVIRPENCNACGNRVKFYKQALKCNNCRVTCHPECKNDAPLPCCPVMRTPTSKGAQGTIAGYAPSSSPMVPSIVYQCIDEINSRGMNEVGLYRVPGSEREVKELKEKLLRGKNIPSLDKVDIHAICGTLKEFLRTLQEPLVTRKLWREFVNASNRFPESERTAAIKNVVSKLPQPNRDTLAVLLIHLRRVSETPECKMPAENIAKVFGPTIVGYSIADPSHTDMVMETRYQFAVMHALLEVSTEYWEDILNFGSIIETCGTPQARPVPGGNRLGPISVDAKTPYKKQPGFVIAKATSTPRLVYPKLPPKAMSARPNLENRYCNTASRNTRSKRFFTSPFLK